MICFRQISPSDFRWIHRVESEAFGRPDEAVLVEKLRAEGRVLLELVAEAHADVVGHLLYSNLPILGEHRTLQGAALAPVAVLPAWQRRGLGGGMIRMSLPMLAHQGVDAVVVLGDEEYYSRFGFSRSVAEDSLISPFPPDAPLMALELQDGCLFEFKGRLQYAKSFGLA